MPDRPTFAELAQEYPKATRLWYKSSRDSLNTGQRAAVEKAYQTKFHIIRGPPGVLIKTQMTAIHVSYILAVMCCIMFACIAAHALYTSNAPFPSLLSSSPLSFPLSSPPIALSTLTGTEKLVVAVHLAYTFAQKNKRIGVRKATGKQYCVLLCAPDDAAVDTTICELRVWSRAHVCLCELCSMCDCFMHVQYMGMAINAHIYNVLLNSLHIHYTSFALYSSPEACGWIR